VISGVSEGLHGDGSGTEVAKEAGVSLSFVEKTPTAEVPYDGIEITDEQRTDFDRDGYLIIRD
jgi:hypothetical protein